MGKTPDSYLLAGILIFIMQSQDSADTGTGDKQAPDAEGTQDRAGEMGPEVICPNCGETSLAYDKDFRRNKCKKCSYVGELIPSPPEEADPSGAHGTFGFRYTLIALAGLIATAFVIFGAPIYWAAALFLSSSAVILFVHFLMQPEVPVEDDLKNLDADGNEKAIKASSAQTGRTQDL